MTPTEAVSGGKGPTDSLARSLTEVSDLAVGGTDRDPAHGKGNFDERQKAFGEGDR